MRTSNIAESITQSINQPSTHPNSFLTFFALFHLSLVRFLPEIFERLRSQVWGIKDDDYKVSFRQKNTDEQQSTEQDALLGNEPGELVPVGDLGYSGSTFFTTPDARFLVKSLPRRFEYLFFTRTLFGPYVEHMRAHKDSLLVRITDLPHAPHITLGGIFGLAPTHHIIMENLLYGKDEGWETYDLKPADYFFPERDIADGKLMPDSVKDRLVDTLPHKIIISAEMKEQLLDALEKDIELLRKHKAVDYSLFVVRYPASQTPPPPPGTPSPWRKGVTDTKGEWTYRAILLDFFWRKATERAKLMEGLVWLLNLVGRDRGPMSITAEPDEYRERFLKMVNACFQSENESTSFEGEREEDSG